MRRSYCSYLIVFASTLLGLVSCSKDREEELSSEILVSSLEFSGIDADQGTPTLAVGDSLKLVVAIVPSNASNKKVVWSSGSPEVAQVGQDGTVRGLSPGETIITVRADDASKAGAEITLRVLNTENAITSFTIVGHEGYRTEIYADSITVTFPADSDVDLGKLTPVIVHTGNKVTPDSEVEQDFTDAVEYIVTAENGGTHKYEVNIRRTLKSTNSITSFTVNGNAAKIEGDAISFSFPADSDVDLTKLKPEIVHTGEKVTPDSGVEQDFTNVVEYIVTAENGETHKYEVNIRRTLKSTNSITSFTVNGNAATIEGDAISFSFPADSDVDLTKLKPEIVHTGKSITPGSGVEQDFTDPVVYTVTAENGDARTYTVTMDIALTAAESDRASLMAIYEANPEAQSRLTNWGSEKPLNEWYGVTTNAEGRVTKFQLYDFLYLKVLPCKIGDLTALETLDLAYNQLTEIPSSIGKLTALKILYLGVNRLTEIPESIGKLTALEDLSLAYNQLTEIPDRIGDLTALTYLDLGANQLTEIPESIGKLTALTSLSLYNNQLKTIPEEIGKLTSLSELWLQNNPLTSIPSSVCELGSSMGSGFGIDDPSLCE
ncbi:leucine-rich repeat domain-containing protein [Allomuricauda taeanensis]|uniref:leucine-rich repeat domain-containing protein n=1 Tax=Flagellimonas taeanensis TaxID=1005926 RepID=UPI002E7C3438|nr:leucine-rich repeat domain-containing protein [Allomuricauda taeanensis]MEE1964620.1 leucine-rich repeat domain-containing protein [Allomuricauda taeanensis]